jgi:hypothetical protein
VDAQSVWGVGGWGEQGAGYKKPAGRTPLPRGGEGGRRDRDPKQSGVNYSGGGKRNGGNLSGELVDLEPEVVAGAAAEEVTFFHYLANYYLKERSCLFFSFSVTTKQRGFTAKFSLVLGRMGG